MCATWTHLWDVRIKTDEAGWTCFLCGRIVPSVGTAEGTIGLVVTFMLHSHYCMSIQ